MGSLYIPLYYTILYSTVLYLSKAFSRESSILYYKVSSREFSILHNTTLYCTVLCCAEVRDSVGNPPYYIDNILHCTVLYLSRGFSRESFILYYTILYYTVLYYTVMYCSRGFSRESCILYYAVLYLTREFSRESSIRRGFLYTIRCYTAVED